MEVKNIGTERAMQKIKHYCAYQERCHQEVKDKLYSYGLRKMEVEELLSVLINENYLNEERFAIAFAGGKFRMKQWGRNKIKNELRLRQVSDYCIKKGLYSIPDDEYEVILKKLFDQKLAGIKSEKNIYRKKAKIYAYLVQKGFENDLVNSLLARL